MDGGGGVGRKFPLHLHHHGRHWTASSSMGCPFRLIISSAQNGEGEKGGGEGKGRSTVVYRYTPSHSSSCISAAPTSLSPPTPIASKTENLMWEQESVRQCRLLPPASHVHVFLLTAGAHQCVVGCNVYLAVLRVGCFSSHTPLHTLKTQGPRVPKGVVVVVVVGAVALLLVGHLQIRWCWWVRLCWCWRWVG